MRNPSDERLLEVLLDSWERNNQILVNFLRALPAGGLDARAAHGSPSIAQMFSHIHYVRLVFVQEDAPEFSVNVPEQEWFVEHDRDRIAESLHESAKVVSTAVRGRLDSDRGMDLHYDHPVLFLQHMLWHEGYHHGQMKLALKMADLTMANEHAGPLTWKVWMQKTSK
jgi:uncharacterized damage-inducible protein DinB